MSNSNSDSDQNLGVKRKNSGKCVEEDIKDPDYHDHDMNNKKLKESNEVNERIERSDSLSSYISVGSLSDEDPDDFELDKILSYDEEKARAQRIERARQVVPGWNKFNPECFTIHPLRGGLTNLLYVIHFHKSENHLEHHEKEGGAQDRSKNRLLLSNETKSTNNSKDKKDIIPQNRLRSLSGEPSKDIEYPVREPPIPLEELQQQVFEKVSQALERDQGILDEAGLPAVTAVLYREFGVGTEAFMNRENEQAVATEIGNTEIAPFVFHTFPEGRVEEFLHEASSLSRAEFASIESARRVVYLLAKLHAQEVPKQLKNDSLKDKLYAWWNEARKASEEVLQTISQGAKESESAKRKALRVAALNIESLGREVDFLVKFVFPEVDKPSSMVFCHGDLQEGNVMKQPDGEYFLIDYEYSVFANRGLDLGNMFCEMSIDYNIKNYPGFVLNPDQYPSVEKQEAILSVYAKTILKMQNNQKLNQEGENKLLHDNNNSIPQTTKHTSSHSLKTLKNNISRSMIMKREQKELVNILLKEAEAYSLVSHLLWAFWSVVQGAKSTIQFGYMEFAMARLDMYFQSKKKILRSRLLSAHRLPKTN